MTAKIRLDVCTPEGKTWMAKLTGLDAKFTFTRQFINASSNDTSGSGKTGSKTYTLIEDGVYQSREGRRRLRYEDGRDGACNRFYLVQGDTVTYITEDEAIEELRTPKVHVVDPQPGAQTQQWSDGA